MLFETPFAKKKTKLRMLLEAKNAVKARFCELACIERWLTLPTFKMLANMMEMIEYGKTVVVYLVFLFFCQGYTPCYPEVRIILKNIVSLLLKINI